MSVLTIGEILVEIMRVSRDTPLSVPAEFIGPYPSGAPAIFADAVAKLGFPSSIIGAVGDDEFGMLVLNRLRSDGVDVSRVKILGNYLTGIAFISYFSDGSRRFIFHLRQSASSKISVKDIDADHIARFKHLHIMGSALLIARCVREACYKAVEIARGIGITVSFDPNIRLELMPLEKVRKVCEPIIEKADIVLPNIEEIEALTNSRDLNSACDKLLDKGVDIIALKMGSSGSMICKGGWKKHIPAFEVKEVDPTGAGDIYDAAFIVGLLRGWDIEKAGYYANVAGALAVTKFGPMEGCPTHNEVMDFMRRTNPEILRIFEH
ncbi:MAG: sugar kinase [Candidatus Bathyarchaeota archaeon]|nr:sugar kinase [Candidatus Bathyarchaeota archaeon]